MPCCTSATVSTSLADAMAAASVASVTEVLVNAASATEALAVVAVSEALVVAVAADAGNLIFHFSTVINTKNMTKKCTENEKMLNFAPS